MTGARESGCSFPPCGMCGTPLDPEADFCSECWRAWQAGEWHLDKTEAEDSRPDAICDNCGRVIPDGDVWCIEHLPSTGNDRDDDISTSAQSAPPPTQPYELDAERDTEGKCLWCGSPLTCGCSILAIRAREAERVRIESIIDTHIKIHEHCNTRKSNLRKGAITALQIIRRAVREDDTPTI